ncbi:PilZ domain-containing protein [Ferrimonas balearica]|uniref:PilZ domain-containing protein n=1 Tax=Ferrimonas balearica TaxID=44012 RepID=UPI001C990934|nr:PilZ domain-containing protein [Ferrimonas balearica]MBY5991565.1 PilZ domain-containing protein [Ferrimonas balearica]
MVNLEAQFDTLAQLYRAYMPFVRHGGLFFVSSREYQMGDTIEARYRLPESEQWYEFSGQVVWINPLGSQGGRPPGVGLAFGEEQNPHKPRIEQLLADQLGSNQLTSTM